MAVTLHNANATAGAGSVGARTLLHTSTAGAVLLVWIHSNEATTYSAVAAGLNPLTRLGAVSAGTSRSELWGLTAPPSGTLTISAIPAGTQVATWCLAATTYTGQRQIGGSPFGTVAQGSATAANVALSVSSTSTDLVVYGFGISANTTITTTTGTNRTNTTHSTTGRLVVGDVTGAATLSISATSGASGVWGMLAVPVVASLTATTSLAFDNAAFTATTGVVNTLGLLLTATSNACLLVFTNVGGGDATVSAINAGALSLTRMAILPGKGDTRLYELWVLTAPATGVLTISAVLADDAVTNFGLGAITYTGHYTGTGGPFGGVATSTASATASTSLVVSSTAGNVVVLGFGIDFETTANSAGPGTTARSNSAPWPFVLITDTPGQTNVTASAAANAATQWGNIGINLIQAGVSSNFSAQVSVTDVKDTIAATGYSLLRGQAAVTDKRDTAAAPSRLRITGQGSVTDVKDTVAVPSRLRITGQASVTDVRDTAAVSARNRITGQVAVTDTRDTVAAPAANRITAAVSVADRRDTVVATSYLLLSAIAAVTDRRDTISIPIVQAGAAFQAAVAVTDVRDSIVVSATLPINGSVSVTDRPDSIVVAATAYGAVIIGQVSVTDAPDNISVSINNISPSAEVVTTFIDPGAGGGGKKRKQPYVRLPEDFWAIREQHLRSLQPEMVESAEPAETVPAVSSVPVPIKLQGYRIERASVIQKLQKAPDPPKLYNHTRRLKQLNAHIAEQKRLEATAREQARLKAKQLAEQKRRNKLRKLKRKVAILAIARLLGLLTHVYSKL
jgi:hypothetical protein